MRLLILRRAIENGVRAIKIAQLKCLCASASTAAVARVMRLVWLREREEERESARATLPFCFDKCAGICSFLPLLFLLLSLPLLLLVPLLMHNLSLLAMTMT